MLRNQSVVAAMALTAGLALAVTTATAQAPRAGNANSQMLQQLAGDNANLKVENAALKKAADDAKAELEKLKNEQKALNSRTQESAAALAQSQSQREAAELQLKQSKERMEQLVAKFRETAQTLRDLESEHASTKQLLGTRNQQLNACVDHNQALIKINGEVLTRLENQSVWSRLAAAEPFTKLKRIQMENLVDDYKARAEDQQVVAPPGLAPGVAAPPGYAATPESTPAAPAVPPDGHPAPQ